MDEPITIQQIAELLRTQLAPLQETIAAQAAELESIRTELQEVKAKSATSPKVLLTPPPK